MKLVLVFESNVDVYDESRLDSAQMETFKKDFLLGEKRIILNLRDGTDSVVNSDYLLSVSTLKED